mmetsp:Transcript_7225/g.9366  ORF Transcript_7225/g.9366 Transcript_7225/m.9366 type:complete len:236 (-) Transcript_7225:253-960(-)|eukprot:CAMPEP_0195307326 /NCGR_PEP_ID=MMETSP0707-20130614/37660_1 /TAXON_ID=33640 /ORGANISM="Asterionellopsis glacialis, Strain CCMP134" /LENGTH=235 /DNA_ID=CAMNT_0040371575 /DNA_START=189 /DNA_END=896 /DNA_ORIENTATION=+
MSGRGRGRGRGRGGYTPPTGTQLFLQRSAQEMGLDTRNKMHNNARPLLYPDLLWHSNGTNREAPEGGGAEETSTLTEPKRTTATKYLITKGREIHYRIQNSVFFVRPTLETDVVRFRGKRPRISHRSSDQAVLEKIRSIGPAHIPEELMSLSLPMTKQEKFDAIQEKRRDAKLSLANLEKEESQGGENGEMGDDPEEDMLALSEEEEEGEGEDYTMNYYESEEDSDAGGDAEPTF